MHRAEEWESMFIDTFWRGLEQGAPIVIGFLAAVWLLGYISRRLLRRQPEFALKEAMLRGTWQVPAAITALVGFGVVVQWIGVQYTEYPLSFMVAGFLGMPVLAFLGGWLLPEGADFGYVGAFHMASARLQHKEMDWSKHLAQIQRRRQSRGWRITLVVTGLILVAVPVLLVANYTLPADQEFAATKQLFRLEERVAQQLQDPVVNTVLVVGPPVMDERKVFIQVKKGASDQQILEVHRQVWKIMAQLDPEHVWPTIVGREPGEDHRPTTAPPHPRN